jgi:hypothetical protein
LSINTIVEIATINQLQIIYMIGYYMSKAEKLIKRFRTVPADFTWDEFVKLLSLFDYEMAKGSGSRRKFINKDNGMTMSFHEPHPQSIMKKCYIRQVIQHFDDNKVWPQDD